MNWIVVAVWPDESISFLRVGGTEEGPNLSHVFWELDVEGNPHTATLWYCRSSSSIHIGQPNKDGLFFTFKDGDENRPLDRLYFTEGFEPYDRGVFGEDLTELDDDQD